MVCCSNCTYTNADGARFCGGCGAALDGRSSIATHTLAAPASTSPGEGRFAPDKVLAGRYRILALAGRGGMGEVYRARDTKLDQDVALKFLPEALRWNPAALARLHNEVRIARQVSHPNVCRVYDVGEADGLHFLTMEFIDGEDLAHLLKRISRFPHDKGVEVARKLCAAVAAAHACGVLHRDLKPANIMLNASGQVLVTDFGLAGVAERFEGADVTAGTPAYMAPEQLEGREVTIRSDIYSLGLVLYEVFTGKRAFNSRDRSDFSNPTAWVKDLDPAVERVILRCLAENPKDRPPNALSVAARLPGGDPLEAAIAAGETPSPEMVAAAGTESTIGVRTAVLAFAAVFVCIFLAVLIGAPVYLQNHLPLELPPDALAAKAREISSSLGYKQRPLDTASGFSYKPAQLQQLAANGGWEHVHDRRPTPIFFWYRESPWLLGPVGIDGIKPDDPPLNLSGMISMRLDTMGRLALFQAVPPVRYPITEPREADWNALFTAAGLDIRSFDPVSPDWLPPSASDLRRAWKGPYPGQEDSPVRVEAASLGGRPVYFRIVEPWETTAPGQAPGRTNVFQKVFNRVMWLAAFWLAWLNFRNGRGDRRGAFRVGMANFVLLLIYSAAVGDFDHSFTIFGRYDSMNVGGALFTGAIAWAAYLALEPLVRRKWPHSLVSWSRMLAGRFRDPLLGRDVLLGVAAGCVSTLLGATVARAVHAASHLLTIPSNTNVLPIGAAWFIAQLTIMLSAATTWPLLQAVLFVVLWMAVRSKTAAAVLTWGVWACFYVSYTAPPGFFLPYLLVSAAVSVPLVFAMLRFGVTAAAFAMFTVFVLLLPSGPGWYQNAGQAGAAIVVLLAFYGFRTALAGRRVLGGKLLGQEV